MANESPRCCCSVSIYSDFYCEVPYVSALVRAIISGDKKNEILGLTWPQEVSVSGQHQ